MTGTGLDTTNWLEPWAPIEHESVSQTLEKELQKELPEGHVLFGRPAKAIARRIDQDDVLFAVGNPSEIACVHLTYSSKRETAPWPSTSLFDSIAAFVASQEKETAAPALPPVFGRRLYSPATIAVYTLLSNFGVGLILYSLNLRTRGERRPAKLMLAFGVVSLTLLCILTLQDAPPSRSNLMTIVVALYMYRLERIPFRTALAGGASRARWWPPAAWLVLLAVLMLVLRFFVSTD